MDDFLDDLCSKGFINKVNNCNKSNSNNLKLGMATPKEYAEFYDEKDKWLIKNGFLPKLKIELTYNCNQKCIHCYNEKDNLNSDITFENIKPVIDDAIKCGVYNISLTGGECTLHPDFLKIASYIREKRIGLGILTNGLAFYDNPELFKKIINLYPRNIKLSLYSMDETVHDNITQVKGSQKKVLEVIKKLKKNNVEVIISYFQLENNYGSIKDIEKFVKSIDVPFIAGIYFVSNKQNSNSYCELCEKKLYELFSDENVYSSELNFQYEINEDFLKQYICKAGIDILVVNPFLNIIPCVNYEYILGNLKKENFIDIFKGKKLIEFKKNHINKNLKECFKEDYCINCSYCPGTVFNNKGFLKKSDNACKIAKVLNNIHKNLNQKKEKINE